MARHSGVDRSILEAALIGLEQQRAEIEAKTAEIRRRLRGLGGESKPEGAPAARAKRVLSPAARKRIADATKKRWAAYRAAKAAGGSKRSAAKKTSGRKNASAGESNAS